MDFICSQCLQSTTSIDFKGFGFVSWNLHVHLFFLLWQVQHLDWDIVGMTLATSGKDGNVRLWQANVSGQWQQQGIVESTGEL